MANLFSPFRYRWRYALTLMGLLILPMGIPELTIAAPMLVAQQSTRTPQTVTGNLSTNSPRLESDGSYYETQTFEGTAGETLTIELTSDDFDAYLILQSPTGEAIAEDDDGAGGSNARIVMTVPTTGTYTLVVNSYAAGETGSYRLEWRTATAMEQELARANQLNQHAFQLYQAGRFAEAIPPAEQALSIRETQLAPDHPATALSLNNLAGLYYAQGQLQPTLTYLSRGLAVEETVLSRNLLGGTDANKRDYLATMAGTTDVAITLHLQDLPTNAAAAQLAFTTILQRQGRILDLFTNLRAQLTHDPTTLALLDDLSAASTELATLTYTPPPTLAAEEYRAQLSAFQTRIDDLEDELSRRSTDFANLTASPHLADIQAALPTGTALVQFIRYQPVDTTASAQEQFGEVHYAAYLLQPDGTLQGLDLGPAEAIDTAVRALSVSLASPDTPVAQVKADAKALETRVMAPVRAALGTATTVFLAPDGALNRIPFEALVDESGNYLVETYQFRYLTAGRDLMRWNTTVASRNPAMLLGNPTYGRPGELVAQADTRAIDFKDRIFPSLPGTQAEVDLIAPKLSGAQVYTQTNATEAVIKQQSQPSILHIATHGFFEPEEDTLNPLLQSGLILAGAAAGGQSGPDQDGILTALEVTGLNLSGTQLVVLSACETGLGALSAGEGIYGLRRAFVLAGSQSQVISLWKVSDTATQALMVDYYDRLLAGTPRDAALRETQLAFLESEEYSHPYYWAAFIGSGDWRPLQQ